MSGSISYVILPVQDLQCGQQSSMLYNFSVQVSHAHST